MRGAISLAAGVAVFAYALAGPDSFFAKPSLQAKAADPAPAATVAEAAEYTPRTPGHAEVQLQYVVHAAELFTVQDLAEGPPDMPVEQYAELHMGAHVEKTECAVMKETLAATCVLDDLSMTPLGKGRFLVKARFKFDPKIDPGLSRYRSAPHHGSKTYKTYDPLYIRGTKEELLRMKRHTYAYGPKQCDLVEDLETICHVSDVVMHFLPDENGGAGIHTSTRVGLRWGYDSGTDG